MAQHGASARAARAAPAPGTARHQRTPARGRRRPRAAQHRATAQPATRWPQMTGQRLPAALPLTLVQTVATVGTARAPHTGPAALQPHSAHALCPLPAPRPHHAPACPPALACPLAMLRPRAPGCPHAVDARAALPCGAQAAGCVLLSSALACVAGRQAATRAGEQRGGADQQQMGARRAATGHNNSSAYARRHAASEGLPCPAPVVGPAPWVRRAHSRRQHWAACPQGRGYPARSAGRRGCARGPHVSTPVRWHARPAT